LLWPKSWASPARRCGAALARLEQEGLVDAIPSGGYAVRSFTREDVIDAIELRGVLEGTALRLAAERGG
jgi:GntR family transcriptional regulator of vanillate catabolism